jgi:hypothetical protein
MSANREKYGYDVGDTVERINGSNNGMYTGDQGIVTQIDSSDTTYLTVTDSKSGKASRGDRSSGSSENYRLVPKTNSMTIISDIKIAFKKEPEKTFIQAGIMNMDETFTADGKQAFDAFLNRKFGDDFKKDVVDPIIEAQKSKRD